MMPVDTLECVACGTTLEAPTAVGRLPLPRALLASESETAPRWDLKIAGCPGCGSVAILDGPSANDVLSTLDRPSARTTTSVTRIAREADHAFTHVPLALGETIIALGAGDGMLLRPFQDAGFEVVNVEPAATRRAIAEAAGMIGISRPIGSGALEQLDAKSIQASLVLGRTVLGRVDDPDQVLQELAKVVTRNGRMVFTLPDVEAALSLSPPGLINPEWRWLWTPHALSLMALRNGMIIDHVDRTSAPHAWICSVSMARDESPFPLSRPSNTIGERARAYTGHVLAWRQLISRQVRRSLSKDRRVVAVGAGASGVTALNLIGLTAEQLDGIVDLNPFKQGLWAPGVNVPITGVDLLRPGIETELLALVPGLEPELRTQHADLLSAGTLVRSITPTG